MGYLCIMLTVAAAEIEHTLQKVYKKKHGGGAPILFSSFVALFSFLFFLGKYLITDNAKGDCGFNNLSGDKGKTADNQQESTCFAYRTRVHTKE